MDSDSSDVIERSPSTTSDEAVQNIPTTRRKKIVKRKKAIFTSDSNSDTEELDSSNESRPGELNSMHSSGLNGSERSQMANASSSAEFEVNANGSRHTDVSHSSTLDGSERSQMANASSSAEFEVNANDSHKTDTSRSRELNSMHSSGLNGSERFQMANASSSDESDAIVIGKRNKKVAIISDTESDEEGNYVNNSTTKHQSAKENLSGSFHSMDQDDTVAAISKLNQSLAGGAIIDDSDDEETEAARRRAMEVRIERRKSRRSEFLRRPVSESEEEETTSSSFVNNQRRSSASDIEIPETDEELEESRLHAYSPMTRKSISGRAGRQFDFSDNENEESAEAAAGGDSVSFLEEIANDAALNKSIKRNRSMLSSTINDANASFDRYKSVTNTPQAKRQSQHFDAENKEDANSESIMISSGSEYNSIGASESIAIDDDSTSSSTNRDVITLDSSGEEYAPAKELVQPKISTALGKVSAEKHVSNDYYKKQLDKLNELVTSLKQCEDLYATMRENLPDKGKGLLLRVETLKSQHAAQKKMIANLVVTEDEPLDAKQKSYQSWAEIEAGTKEIAPKFQGAQGMNTFNDQKDQVLSRLHTMHSAFTKCPGTEELADTPYGLKVELMGHQRYGLNWMLWRESKGTKPPGGILADDMGLGKTLSIISLVLASNEKQKGEEESDRESSEDEEEEDDDYGRRGELYYGGTLIVAPASLINQWQAEVEKRVKRNTISCYVHHGNSRETSARRMSKNDIVVTTYGLVGSEAKTRGALFQVKWDRIVLDEAHTIRNHTTAAAMACCHLLAKSRWALTGTPVQNKEMDIFSLFKFLRCTPFNDLAVFKKWMNTNTQGGRDRLANVLKPLMLRRTKAELQAKGELGSITNKTLEIVQFNCNRNEMNVYSKVLALSKTLFAQYLSQRTDRQHMQNMGFGSLPTFEQKKQPNDVYDQAHAKFNRVHATTEEVKGHEILVLITRLRQICNHPALIDAMLDEENGLDNSSDDDNDETAPIMDLLAELNKLTVGDSDVNANVNGHDEEAVSRASQKLFTRANPVFDMGTRSSKCKEVLKVIQNVLDNTEDKIIVVSQWTSMLNIIGRYLGQDRIKYTELTGKTQIKLRNAIVESFNTSGRERVLLLSLVAGGVGLNLVGANHLVLVDPHWNPQLEAQAADRVYRVGQTKPVIIYKMLSEDTIESRIKCLQDKKLQLSEELLTGSRSTASKLTIDDMKKLFDM